MEARSWWLFSCLALLVVACVAVLVLEQEPGPRRRAASAAFQKQVGGLGSDPLLEGGGSAADWPIPGGGCFSPP